MAKGNIDLKVDLEEDIEKLSEVCDNCNGVKKIIASCSQKGYFTECLKYLCKDCTNKCEKCRKHFCPKHIKNHKCKI